MATVDVGDDAALRSALRQLTVASDPDENDEYVVGRPDLGLYAAIPRPGVVLIEYLRDGASLTEATQQATAAAGADVDGAEFLTDLAETGLLDSPVETGATVAGGRRIGWVERIPRAAVEPLFGRVAWTVYGAITALLIVLLLLRPDLRPIFDDIWFLTDPIWSLIALFAVSIAISAGHECWHWLAGRALGITPRFRMGRRGVFLVFETDLSQLVTLPRRVRHSPLVAGFAFDVVLLVAALLLRLGFREEVLNHPPWFDRFLGAVVFRQLFVLVWQLFGVAFRTDSYAVLANALGCQNLYRATALAMKFRLWRLDADEGAELAGMSSRDRSVANWFWLVYLAGVFAMFTLLVGYLVPFIFGTIRWIIPNITSMAPETLVFWQSLVLAALLLGQYAAIPFIARRERRQRRLTEHTPTVVPGRSRSVRSRYGPVWQAAFVALVVATVIPATGTVLAYADESSDAAYDNRLAAARDDSCVPGMRVPIIDYPHVSEQAIQDAVYNSNPPTSGPHYAASVAPGIYRTHLPPGQTVHGQEHGRVVIHYRPDTPDEVVRELESIAKRHLRDTVVHPNPNIDTLIAITAWGRIDTLDSFDEARIAYFVDQLRGKFDHHATDDTSGCHLHDNELSATTSSPRQLDSLTKAARETTSGHP